MWDTKNTKREAPLRPVNVSSTALETAPTSGTSGYGDATRTAATTRARSSAVLSVSHRLKGEISGNEDMLIEGSVEGLIQLGECRLTVGESARVTADVLAGEVVVYGSVKGNLCASKLVEIKRNGSVIGEITTARIMIEDGAYIKGSIEIERPVAGGVAPASEPIPVTPVAISPTKARPLSLQGGTGTLQMPHPVGAVSAAKK
jgi:cytoskeletal protein CcmA (bactofilin family)